VTRIAFVFAAALLGTGCVVTDTTEVGSVNIHWDFLRTAPAQQTGVIRYDDSDDVPGVIDAACDESRVEVVEVTSPLGTTTVYCVFDGVEGIGLDGIGEGVRSFRLRGWRFVGQRDYLVYDGTFDLDVRPNTTTDHFVGIPGVSQPLEMYGGLYDTSTSEPYADCAAAATPVGSASPPYFGYEIRDVHGSLVVNGTAGCAAGLPAPVFVGDLVSFYARVVKVGRTSITVDVEVYAQRGRDGRTDAVKVTEAQLTYVAVDSQRHPRKVPGGTERA